MLSTTTGPISLNATSGSLPATSTGMVPVSPAPAAKLVIQNQPSQTATAGSPFSTQPVIYEEDQFGNLLTSDNTTSVTAYLGSGSGPLHGTVAATVKGGIATFTGLSESAAGTISLLFTGAGVTSIPSVPVVISPATASKLVIQTGPSAAATAGQPFAIQPTVALEDSFGNIETTDNSTKVTAALASGAGPLLGATSITVHDGVATFTNLADNQAEAIALSFAGQGFNAGPSTGITISPAAASTLVIKTQPSSTAKAGQTFPTQPLIYEEDQYGNLETGDNSTVVTASLVSGAGPLQGIATVTLSRGIATFTSLSDRTAEAITLRFLAGTITSPASSAIQITATIPTASVRIANTKTKKSPSTVITIQYSTTMDSNSAGLSANYKLFATTGKGKKKKTTNVNFKPHTLSRRPTP